MGHPQGLHPVKLVWVDGRPKLKSFQLGLDEITGEMLKFFFLVTEPFKKIEFIST